MGVHVKGTAFVGRRAHLVDKFGEAAFLEFFDVWREGETAFDAEVLTVTLIPVAAFLRFNDAVVEHFYQGDTTVHWRLGRASADWAFSLGPYKAFFQTGDYAKFLRTAPSLWKAYYSEGGFHTQWDPETRRVDARIEVPAPHQHVHFELNVMGYLHRGLELTGGRVTKYRAIDGFTLGDAQVHYTFDLSPA